MSKTKELLKGLNEDLFSGRQPSKEHEMFIVGKKTANATDPKKFDISYTQKSKPNKAAVLAGVRIQDFIHAAFKPLGTISVDDSGKRSFSGPKKARVGVIFLNTQPDLYNFVKEGLDAGETTGAFTKAGFDALKRPMIKMRDTMFGLKITFNTPSYTPHSVNAEGAVLPLKATTYDPKTGKYAKKEVVIGTYTFFADDDDLDNLLEVCGRHYDKHIAPFLTESVTTITKKGNKETVEVKEEDLVGPEAMIFDEEGNSVDEKGEVLETAEDLAARGIIAPEATT